MKKTEFIGISVYTFNIFDNYPDLLAFTTTRKGIDGSDFNLALHTGDDPEKVLGNRKLLANAIGISADDFTCPEQTHSTNIQIVTETEKGRGSKSWEDGFPDTDALITNVRDLPIAVLTADCAGVFFYDPVKQAIAITHAGRKGAEGGIVPKTIDKMKAKFGSRTQDLIVGVGPCVHSCCYEMDLPGLIEKQLLDVGIKIENIEISGICTSCHNDEFFSYRADGGETGRFMNLIMLK